MLNPADIIGALFPLIILIYLMTRKKSVPSILGLYNKEGFILKRTVIPMGIYGIVAGLLAAILPSRP